MTRILRFLRRDKAAAIVEFALVVPLFVVLVVGIMVFSQAYTRMNALTAALRDGARMAATDQYADSASRQTVIKTQMRQFSSAFGFPLDTTFVTINYVPGGPDVTVSVTNYPLFAGLNFFGGLQSMTVTRSVVFRHEWSP